MQPGDKVRVEIDTNGGWHPLVGEKGYYSDVVRNVGKEHVVLTHVSWVPPENCQATSSNHAMVTINGISYKIQMLNRGKVWWAKIPHHQWIEPLACEESYEKTLREAVIRLYCSYSG